VIIVEALNKGIVFPISGVGVDVEDTEVVDLADDDDANVNAVILIRVRSNEQIPPIVNRIPSMIEVLFEETVDRYRRPRKC
jgi:hypothetical protein